MIRDYYAAGKLDELCNELLNDSLDEEARRSLGQIHRTFMGGEYTFPITGGRKQQ
jgi:hypothetical protein